MLIQPSCYYTDQGVVAAQHEARGAIDNDVMAENEVRGSKDGRDPSRLTRHTVCQRSLTLHQRRINAHNAREGMRIGQPNKHKKRPDLSEGIAAAAALHLEVGTFTQPWNDPAVAVFQNKKALSDSSSYMQKVENVLTSLQVLLSLALSL